MSNIPKEISFRIDLSKVLKEYIWQGKDGQKFLELKAKNTPDSQYGKDYMIVQDFGKEDRDKIKASGGDWPKTPILGNGIAWNINDGRKADYQNDNAPQKPQAATQNNVDDDLPF